MAGKSGLTRVLAVAPHANPHLTSIYDALAREADLDLCRASLSALPAERLALGWSEMDEDAPYLQPWRRLRDRWALAREMARADVAILPGPFHLKQMPAHFAWRLAFSRGPILTWSEPFLRFRERSAANLRLLSGVARALNSGRVHLLSIGPGAIADYRAIGVSRWDARLFAFAVEPRASRVAGDELSNAESARQAGPLRLLFAGELIERKRVDLLLEALARPEMASASWELEIIGDGPERDALASLARRSGLSDRVVWRGVLPRDRVLAHLQGVDAVILPSRFDGWGAVINEALEAGVAVVVSDACGAASMLDHGRSGLVFRAGDAGDLAANLARLSAEGALAGRLGAAGHEAVLSHRPEAIAARLAAVCRGLAGAVPMPRFDAGLLRALP